MFTTGVSRKFKGRRPQRQRNARRSRIVPNRTINSSNCLELRNFVDVTKPTLPVEVKIGSATPVVEERSPYYRPIIYNENLNSDAPSFDLDSIDPSKLDWNDGMFWWWGTNFTEVPMQSSLVSYSMPAGYTNALIDGRYLQAGSTCFSNDKHSLFVENDRGTNSYVPIWKTKQCDFIRPVSQLIKLKQNLIFSVPPNFLKQNNTSGTGTNPRPYYTPSFSYTPNYPTYEGNSSTEYYNTAANTGLRDMFSYCIRNIIIQLPPDLEHSLNLENAKYSNDAIFTDSDPRKYLEALIMSELFLRDDHTYGPPGKNQRDLYRLLNPKFKVLRDFKEYFSPPTSSKPPNPKTLTFYHRYKSSVPQYLSSHSIQTPLAPERESASTGDHKPRQTYLAGTTGTTPASRTFKPVQCQLAQYQSLDQAVLGPMVDEGNFGEQAIADGSTNAQYLKIKEFDGDVATATDDINVNVPKTSRIVWLRIPRFASTMELKLIKDGSMTIPQITRERAPAASGEDAARTTSANAMLAACLVQSALAMRGFTSFKVLKNQCTGSEGIVDLASVDRVLAGEGGATGHARTTEFGSVKRNLEIDYADEDH